MVFFFLKLQLKTLKIYTLFLLLNNLSTQDSNHGLPIFLLPKFKYCNPAKIKWIKRILMTAFSKDTETKRFHIAQATMQH